MKIVFTLTQAHVFGENVILVLFETSLGKFGVFQIKTHPQHAHHVHNTCMQ